MSVRVDRERYDTKGELSRVVIESEILWARRVRKSKLHYYRASFFNALANLIGKNDPEPVSRTGLQGYISNGNAVHPDLDVLLAVSCIDQGICLDQDAPHIPLRQRQHDQR